MASMTLFTVSTVLSKVLSTPVTTSINSLPAFFALSAAPAKSPLNTFTIASPKKPIDSIAELKRSTMLSTMACPKFFIDCIGSSKIALKESTTPPTLSKIKLKKSLNAKLNASKVVLKKSATF